MQKLLFIIAALVSTGLNAQLAVNTNISAPALAKIIFPGANIQITNATSRGCELSNGSFTANNTNLGLSQGVILVSGDATGAIGPNNSAAGSTAMPCTQSLPDADIETMLAPYVVATSYDASILEFDLLSNTDADIAIPFVFGSEEYPMFLNFTYCDAIGIFVNEQGQPKQNIALVPNTTTPVGVDFINAGSYPELYVDNGDGSIPTGTIQFNGFTVPLMAEMNVLANTTYHIKIVVADVGDYGWDAGAFIGPALITTTATGVNEINAALDVKLYPNPSNGIVNLTYQHIAGKSSVEVYDATGRIVYTSVLQNNSGTTQVPTENLLAGIYHVKVSAGTEKPWMQKLVVVK